MEVYQIRSQFSSMCLMSQAYIENPDGSNQDEDPQHMAKALKSNDSSVEGIRIPYFIKQCPFLVGSLAEINKRILVAIGLDIENQNALVTWPTFLELYCIFEAGRIEKSSLIKFWIKFFDQNMTGTVREDDYMKLLEELVRGNSLSKASKTTWLFAKMIQKMMANAGCLGDNNEIIGEKLSAAFEREDIDI